MSRPMTSLALVLGLLGCSLAIGLHNAPSRGAEKQPAFAFQKGDTVAIYGNGLADRMQHAGWVETLLQSQLVGLDVRFRNLSFAGD
ncbi:MAG: hypothetical protein ACKOTB_08310, partial [Planctomycetia bacterium]